MSRILDLGSHQLSNMDECVQDKIETRVMDDAGLLAPSSISLVIPVRFGRVKEETDWGLEEKAFHRVLREVSQLVDQGYLDELIVVDGTVGPDGRPDLRVLHQVVRTAYEEIGLFRDQVKMLQRYKVQGEMARRGYTDFFVKVLHQFDRNFQKVLLRYGVSSLVGYFGVPRGKGAALWLSVPVASGDVVAYVDADIVNFQRAFVVALTHPILYSWHVDEPRLQFVKAYYERATMVEGTEGCIYGGRVCRLLAKPLLEVMTQRGLYSGIESLRYPLAGEFAIARGAAKRLGFTSDYTIEVAMLTQLHRLVGPEAMAQVSLDIFYHIGQPFASLRGMAEQIATYLVGELTAAGGEADAVPPAYQDAARRRVQADAQAAAALAARVEGMELHHAPEEDEQRLEEYIEIVRQVAGRAKMGVNTQRLPSWNDIENETGNYVQISRMLRRRAIQSTWSRLTEVGHLEPPDRALP